MGFQLSKQWRMSRIYIPRLFQPPVRVSRRTSTSLAMSVIQLVLQRSFHSRSQHLWPCLTWPFGRCARHGEWAGGWLVPNGLWEIARPLLPPAGVRPQGGGVVNNDDEACFVAIVYVLVIDCAWRALPPCFGASKLTVHLRFDIWSCAGAWDQLHQKILHLLDEQDLSTCPVRSLTPLMPTRAKKGRTCRPYLDSVGDLAVVEVSR